MVSHSHIVGYMRSCLCASASLILHTKFQIGALCHFSALPSPCRRSGNGVFAEACGAETLRFQGLAPAGGRPPRPRAPRDAWSRPERACCARRRTKRTAERAPRGRHQGHRKDTEDTTRGLLSRRGGEAAPPFSLARAPSRPVLGLRASVATALGFGAAAIAGLAACVPAAPVDEALLRWSDHAPRPGCELVRTSALAACDSARVPRGGCPVLG